MTRSEIFFLCFAVGTLWALATFLLGSLHLGHGHAGHGHGHGGHAHGVKGHSFKAHAHPRWACMINPSVIAVFLAWFGGVGYLLTRHTGLMLWVDAGISVNAGLFGAWILASFLHFLQSREQPLDPADYDPVGVLGQVSMPIRSAGVGEILYVNEGTRRCLPARSEDGAPIERGQEVVVMRYDHGIAYVRTWEAMTR